MNGSQNLNYRQRLGESDAICGAVDTWQQADVIRGKGTACRQSRHSV